MPQAVSVSLKKFSQSVQAAVKAAVAKHPKFKLEPASGVSVSYLIRGFPVPDGVLRNVSIQETQAFAADVAQQIAVANPDLFPGGARGAQGAIVSIGGHVIVGIPPVEPMFELQE